LREAALQQNSGVESTLARRRRRRHAVGTGGQQRSGPGRAVHVLGGVTRAVGRVRVPGGGGNASLIWKHQVGDASQNAVLGGIIRGVVSMS
jgi:hypothetical protein